MRALRIEEREIGAGRPTFVIAEIGVNHDGSRERAVELACIAAACGADAVKLQFFSATRLVHPSGAFADYQRQRVAAATPAEMLARYELSEADVERVVEAVRDLSLVPLATPFSPDDVGRVESLGLPAVKIASPDLVNRPLLARAARLGRPLLLSTGAATMEEVERAARWLRGWGTEFALLHCISGYPVRPEEANLCWINELAQRFAVPVGYSDHTTLASTGALAAAAGAAVVEKHLTHDRAADGPDHAASADPQQFAKYVRRIREADVLRGKRGKRVLDVELDVRVASRQSLVLRRALRGGELVAEADLTAQRPGKGVSPAMIGDVVGRAALRSLPAGTMLQWDMLGGAEESALSDAA